MKKIFIILSFFSICYSSEVFYHPDRDSLDVYGPGQAYRLNLEGHQDMMKKIY